MSKFIVKGDNKKYKLYIGDMKSIPTMYRKVRPSDDTTQLNATLVGNNLTVTISNPSDYTLYNIEQSRLYLGLDIMLTTKSLQWKYRPLIITGEEGKEKEYKLTNKHRTRELYHPRFRLANNIETIKVDNVNSSYTFDITNLVESYYPFNLYSIMKWAKQYESPAREYGIAYIRPILIRAYNSYDGVSNNGGLRTYAPSNNLIEIHCYEEIELDE